MKHLSHKVAVSLLASSVVLSSVNASGALLEIPRVVSSTQRTAVKLNEPQVIVDSLHTVWTQLEQALLSGAEAQEEILRLKAEYNALKSEAAALKFKNVVLEAQKAKEHAEKQSTWQKFKNWVSKIDGTKVITTIVSGLITLVGTLLLLLL